MEIAKHSLVCDYESALNTNVETSFSKYVLYYRVKPTTFPS